MYVNEMFELLPKQIKAYITNNKMSDRILELLKVSL